MKKQHKHIVNFYFGKRFAGAVIVKSRTSFVNPKDISNARRKLIHEYDLLEPTKRLIAFNAIPVLIEEKYSV